MPRTHPITVEIYPNGTVLSKTVGRMDIHGKAVPVPQHYDLIDHNALKIAVMNGDCETRIDFLKHTMDCINKAPVVIPSDMPTYEEEEWNGNVE
jgi:hypothetical protein